MTAGRIGVLGAGTMGAGIAQVAAEAGFDVVIHDPVAGAVERARERIAGFVQRRAGRGEPADAEATLARIGVAGSIAALAAEARLVVEAIPEDLEMKRDAFRQLDASAAPGTILATNTSSLPVARIAAATRLPGRVVGMHFFNPVPLMSLVEVVAGPLTEPSTADAAAALARELGKTPIAATDSPGFIVNRVQRPFYLEALRIIGEGAADVAEVDAAVRGIGFRMGPFELIDTIGLDVNLAVSESVFAQFFFDPRYRPQPIQRMLVDAGRLGRKSGGGFYEYADADAPRPWPGLPRPVGERLGAAAIADRILATVVNEAASAVSDGVASGADVDTAMRLGTHYPQGPLAWGEELGLAEVVARLDALAAAVPDGRYRVTPLLRALAASGGSFFAERRSPG